MFKLYQDKSSLNKKNSRLLQGGTTSIVGNKLGWWERKNIDQGDADEIIITLDRRQQWRPDIVAYEYLGKADFDWIILQYNNIIDIQEEFIYNKKIRIPSNSYISRTILTKSAGI